MLATSRKIIGIVFCGPAVGGPEIGVGKPKGAVKKEQGPSPRLRCRRRSMLQPVNA
jgi:hypothetical protein